MDVADGLAFAFVVLDSSFNAVDADANPTYKIYSSSGFASGTPMTGGTGTTTKMTGETGIYMVKHQLNSSDGFTPGEHYHVVISYTVATVAKRAVVDFVAV